jgi:hypothetical protein
MPWYTARDKDETRAGAGALMMDKLNTLLAAFALGLVASGAALASGGLDLRLEPAPVNPPRRRIAATRCAQRSSTTASIATARNTCATTGSPISASTSR